MNWTLGRDKRRSWLISATTCLDGSMAMIRTGDTIHDQKVSFHTCQGVFKEKQLLEEENGEGHFVTCPLARKLINWICNSAPPIVFNTSSDTICYFCFSSVLPHPRPRWNRFKGNPSDYLNILTKIGEGRLKDQGCVRNGLWHDQVLNCICIKRDFKDQNDWDSEPPVTILDTSLLFPGFQFVTAM